MLAIFFSLSDSESALLSWKAVLLSRGLIFYIFYSCMLFTNSMPSLLVNCFLLSACVVKEFFLRWAVPIRLVPSSIRSKSSLAGEAFAKGRELRVESWVMGGLMEVEL